MTRALALGLMLIATAVSATELAPTTRNTREDLGQKTQWAPSGNFSALHGRAVFRGEIRAESRPYARARGEVASGIGIFLSRDSIGASSYLSSPNGMGPWSYANLSPARYTDPDGRSAATDYCTGLAARSGGTLNFGACIEHFNNRGRVLEGTFNKNYRPDAETVPEKIVFGLGLSVCLPCQVGWDGSKSIHDADEHGRGAAASLAIGVLGGTGGRGLIEGVVLSDLASGEDISSDEGWSRSWRGGLRSLEILGAAGAYKSVYGRQAYRAPSVQSVTNATKSQLLKNLNVSRMGSASSRFGEYLDAVKARRNSEWMATPEAREGFDEYMTELGVPNRDEFAGMGVELEAGPSTARQYRPPPGMRAREALLGKTPDKFSKTGREVVERMRKEGLVKGEGPLLRGNPNNLELDTGQGLVRIDDDIDMAHTIDAVSWWNENRHLQPRGPEVRQFMLNPANYVLQQGGPNSSAGARLRQVYLEPLFP